MKKLLEPTPLQVAIACSTGDEDEREIHGDILGWMKAGGWEEAGAKLTDANYHSLRHRIEIATLKECLEENNYEHTLSFLDEDY